MKFVVISGGVVSGLGKGITSSSIGVLLKESGVRVTSIKIDPYLNTDAGTMSPYEHGEVFVLDDGGEADLDLGNYERFLDISLTRDHNITTGKMYQVVINKERRGDYLGKTVQVVPHVTDAIIAHIQKVAFIPVDGTNKQPDVCLIELGGTVGDIESMVFLEAIRQLRYKIGQDNFCQVHVSLVPVVGAVGEPKSKPTQHGVKELRSAGISPDIIVCRSTEPLSRDIISKISMHCMVPPSSVISVHDAENVYQVPVMLLAQRLPSLIMSCLKINKMAPERLLAWENLSNRVAGRPYETSLPSPSARGSPTPPAAPFPVTRIAFVGKYTGLGDSYLSVTKALTHAAATNGTKLQIDWIESTDLEQESTEDYEVAVQRLHNAHGLLIPGGFGGRGVNGKVVAVNYARLNKMPFFGICLGMQVAVIEAARTILGLADANSTEFDEKTSNPVVVNMPEISTEHLGGTMRLGARKTNIAKGSLGSLVYGGKTEVMERHRHRYEVNPLYVERLEKTGLVFSGKDDKNERMEITELPTSKHPFYIGVQYHPEFKSRPMNPHPLFMAFMAAALKRVSDTVLNVPATSVSSHTTKKGDHASRTYEDAAQSNGEGAPPQKRTKIS
eukprot:gb/GEZN01004132.1/.p1 GENE.gb/GEZN01004132.1/~~gb/GEZN01004132.1/.p1  ORF type:complete len:615 (-),score=82.86 gb/GEZN01004132.1/:107-1951(-)